MNKLKFKGTLSKHEEYLTTEKDNKVLHWNTLKH